MFAFIGAMSDSERWAYGLLFLAAMTWGGHWLAQRLNHGLAVARENRSRQFAASAVFRSTVLNIFVGLYPEPKDWPSDGNSVDKKLQSVFPALQAAVADFRDSLPIRQRKAFDKAWANYLHGSDGSDRSHYYQYMGYSSPDMPIPDSKATFKHNVECLLSYAKET